MNLDRNMAERCTRRGFWRAALFGAVLLGVLCLESGTAFAGTIRYTEPMMGYRVDYPDTLQVDESLRPLCTVFSNDECRVEIYRQPLDGASYASYVNYSNGGVAKNTADHQGYSTVSQKINGYTVQITRWHRAPLKQVPNDKNYYYTADFRKTANLAYSVFIKSTRDISRDAAYMGMLRSLRFIEPTEALTQVSFRETAEEQEARLARHNLETRVLQRQYFSGDAPLTWGIFEPTAPGNLTNVLKLEEQLGQRFKFLLYYHHLFGSTSIETVIQGLERAYSQGYIVELTLQTGDYKQDNAMYDILNGEQDAYLKHFAQAVAAFEHPVLLRFGNEMNGDWCIYSAYHTGKDTEIYKQCYRYLHDIFAAAGADNVLWVWNPNGRSFPDFTWNAMELYYPGNAYVDLVGLTGYNTGTYYAGETWSSFDAIYAPLYQKSLAMCSQPLLITEFACSSIGGDKAAWIDDMFRGMDQYPAIKVAIWWNACDWAVPGEVPARPYWLDETAETLAHFKAGWAAQNAAQEAARAGAAGEKN